MTTAAEIISQRADPELPMMGLKSWSGPCIRQHDVTVAKNYFDQSELKELNEIVVMYLDYAESQARRRKTMTMREWEEKLNTFLVFNEKDLLDHAGKVSAQVAEQLALECYSKFSQRQRQEERLRADAEDIVLLEAILNKAKLKT